MKEGTYKRGGFYSYGCTAWWAGSDKIKASDKTMRYSGKELDATDCIILA